MIQSLLIANRGEIACRIIRTARQMGIRTVAVYSDADAQALHVRQADEAVHIGPSPARESYLVGEKIIDAAKATGAEAIHPGYGFLAENATFADAVAAAGLAFIGPSGDAIRTMGDKVAARVAAMKAGVPCVPGSQGRIDDPDEARRVAQSIGFPVMIKAVAGGGGRGMRVAHNDVAMVKAYHTARTEAEKAFGNSGVYIEKFIENPHHIEFQILGDTKGNLIHLGERDCSIQRRNQKLIEETPSPYFERREFRGLRSRMGKAALKIAELAGYTSAGTVEFIADDNGNFYFLEVNKRIQVEHPITEEVTGVDLVKQQILIALVYSLDHPRNLGGQHNRFTTACDSSEQARAVVPQTRNQALLKR